MPSAEEGEPDIGRETAGVRKSSHAQSAGIGQDATEDPETEGRGGAAQIAIRPTLHVLLPGPQMRCPHRIQNNLKAATKPEHEAPIHIRAEEQSFHHRGGTARLARPGISQQGTVVSYASSLL